MKNTGRIILNIRDGIDPKLALELVLQVVSEGRISADGNCYCYATVFRKPKIAVIAENLKTGTDIFHVYQDK